MQTIKLLKSWDAFDVDTILRVDEKTASELIEAKTAVIYDEDAEKKQAEAQAEAESRIIAAVKSAVKEEIEATAPVVTKVYERSDDDPKAGFKHFGEFAASVKSVAVGKGLDERLAKAPAGMSETIDADGGFAVPEEFRAELLKNTYEKAAVAGRARAIPMASRSLVIPRIAESSRADGSRAGGVRAYWGAEANNGTAVTSSKPGLGQVKLELNDLFAMVYATNDMLEDSAISMEPLINEVVADELAFALDEAIINGTGAGTPLGILNAACLVSVAKEVAQTAATLVFENVAKMWSRMHGRSRANAVWFINQDIEPQLFTMGITVGTGGIPVYLPANGAAGSPYGTLFGRPVIPIENCATLGTVGDIILADMTQYLLGQKTNGIDAQTSMHVKFTTDEMAFRFKLRVDGQPWWSSTLTPYKGSSNTVSPFVALATRA